MMKMFRDLVFLTAVCAGVAQAQSVASDGLAEMTGRGGSSTPLARQIEGLLADPAVSRAHWGIKVTGMDGSPIYSLNEGQLFQPASNAKLYTTAAAIALLGTDRVFATQVFAKGSFANQGELRGDVILWGGGDANLSGREIPYVPPALRTKPAPPSPPALRYLEELADQIEKTGLKVVNGDVVGNDTIFPWEPYPEDWSIDDAVWGYGAPVSALTVSDNQIKLKITPGTAMGKPATVTMDPAIPYYTVDVSGLVTGGAKSGTHVEIERALGAKALRVYGSIAVDAQPDEEEVAIHDPAEYAAVALKAMLEARGIVVTGKARAEHRLPVDSRGFVAQAREPLPANSGGRSGLDTETMKPEMKKLAEHPSSALGEDIVVTNKVSQNLHAELMLRQLGYFAGEDGSAAQGARVVRSFLTTKVGIDPDDFVFFDGSGLSGHDLVTPRATVKLLQYASTQPWFAYWKRSLPVGGQDGSLAERFGKDPLKNHVFAKTGTLGEARALSGFLEGASGRTVIFSIMVGNHMPRSNADREVMDKIVAAIAAAN